MKRIEFRWVAVVGAIALAGLALRLWGIRFGLPYVYHPDESVYISSALYLGSGEIGKIQVTTGFYNLLFPQYAALFLLGKLAGLYPSAKAYEAAYRADPSTWYLLARLTSAVLGTLTIVVTYKLGALLWDRVAGIAGALLLAVAFLHVRNSHFAAPDVAVTFFAALTVMLCLLALARGKSRYLYLAGAAAGYTTAAKWPVILVGLPVLLTLIFHVRNQHAAGNRVAWWKEALWTGLTAAFTFVLGAFEVLIKPRVYLEFGLNEFGAGNDGGFNGWLLGTMPGWIFYLRTLFVGLGAGVLVLMVLGLVAYLATRARRHTQMVVVFLTFPLVYFVLMGMSRHYFVRYALPLVPFAMVLAGFAVGMLWQSLTARQAARGPGSRALAPLAVGALLVLVMVQPLADSLRLDYLLTQTDTRTMAKQWIEQNVLEGTKIAQDWPWHTPALSTAERASPNSARTYNVLLAGNSGLPENSLDWYRRQGYEYLVTSSFISDIPMAKADWTQYRKQFYDALDQESTLVQELRPTSAHANPSYDFEELYGPYASLWERDRPGPVIRVYRLEPKSEAQAVH